MGKDDRLIGAIEERSQVTLKAIDKLDSKFDNYMTFAANEREILKARVSALESFRIKVVAVAGFVGAVVSFIFKHVFN